MQRDTQSTSPSPISGTRRNSASDNAIILNQIPDGGTRLEVSLHGDTIWIDQPQLAALFDMNVPAVSKHVRNILDSGELCNFGDSVILGYMKLLPLCFFLLPSSCFAW
jgi:hypothetical protein